MKLLTIQKAQERQLNKWLTWGVMAGCGIKWKIKKTAFRHSLLLQHRVSLCLALCTKPLNQTTDIMSHKLLVSVWKMLDVDES